MDLEPMANYLQFKNMSVEMPGRFADLDFDLVAITQVPKIIRGFCLAFKQLEILNLETALIWQNNHEMMLKRARPGLIKAAELPKFVLGIIARKIPADARLAIKKDLKMLRSYNDDGRVFVFDEAEEVFFGHDKTLKRISELGISEILLH